MNLINTILILIIIIFLINYFSNGQILTSLKRIFHSCQTNLESFTNKKPGCYPHNAFNIPFANQVDIPYINNNDIKNMNIDTFSIYDFINELVTKNVNIDELTPSSGPKIQVNKEMEQYIINNLLIISKCNKYFFSNIKLNQDLYYFENYKGKELEPFIFTTDIHNDNKNLGNYTLVIDCFFRYDKKTEPLTIKSIKIIKRNTLDNITENTVQKHLQITKNMNNSFNDIVNPVDNNDLFIIPPNNKKVTFQNNETDSLIPSIDEILSI